MDITPEPDEVRRPATPQELSALGSALRLRVIRELYDGPLTNNEIAARLGRDKATVLHHVRVLAAAGFLEALPPRRGARGSRERPYRSTGKSWRLEGTGTLPSVADAGTRAFVEEVTQEWAQPSSSRLALRLSPARHAELGERLDRLLQEFAELPPDPDGQPWAVFVSVYRRRGST